MISATGASSLLDMCATSIVYKIWTNQDIYENQTEENHWQLLENKVTADVKRLPFKKLLKSFLLSFVKPVGWHFFNFLNVWLKKLVTSERWLTNGMLSDCLTLYPLGIINGRKTAEKLLNTKMMDNMIAFRLACINFLQVEVLRLWPHVSKYFLNKIYQNISIDDSVTTEIEYPLLSGCVAEPREVLFWIAYCLSEGNGTYLSAILCGDLMNWFDDAFRCAIFSGDIAFFEYIRDSYDPYAFYAYESRIIRHRLYSKDQIVSFFYHFSSLKMKYSMMDLVREAPMRFVSYFLQWPLSSLFLNDPEGVCDLFVELDLMDWLFVKILEILHGTRYMGHVCSYKDVHSSPTVIFSDVYNRDHLERIWVTLWSLCPGDIRARIVSSFVFTVNLHIFLHKASSQLNCDRSALTKDLWSLLLSNGRAFLMFLNEKNLADALEKVVSIYFPLKKLDFDLLQVPHFPNRPNYAFHRSIMNLVDELVALTNPDAIIDRNKRIRIVEGLHLPDHLNMNDEMGVLTKRRLFKSSGLLNLVGLHFIKEFLVVK